MTSLQAILGKESVQKLIPQKFPFAMVDTLYAFTDNGLQSGLTIASENIFFDGDHFLEPGIIEHMAQSVALHTGYQYDLRNQPAPTGYIGSISQCEISELPKLGDTIQSEVEILQEFGGITLVNIASFLNGKQFAKAQMKTVLAQ